MQHFTSVNPPIQCPPDVWQVCSPAHSFGARWPSDLALVIRYIAGDCGIQPFQALVYLQLTVVSYHNDVDNSCRSAVHSL